MDSSKIATVSAAVLAPCKLWRNFSGVQLSSVREVNQVAVSFREQKHAVCQFTSQRALQRNVPVCEGGGNIRKRFQCIGSGFQVATYCCGQNEGIAIVPCTTSPDEPLPQAGAKRRTRRNATCKVFP